MLSQTAFFRKDNYMDNGRKDIRHPLKVDVKISHPDIGIKIVKTENISESGLFILVEPTEMPSEGERVQGQILNDATDLPEVTMEIVRVAENGLGLRFVE